MNEENTFQRAGECVSSLFFVRFCLHLPIGFRVILIELVVFSSFIIDQFWISLNSVAPDSNGCGETNTKEFTMKQRKLCACNISSSSECNGHVKSFIKPTNPDECQRTNGNCLRNSEIPVDKTKKGGFYETQTEFNRSQRCLKNDTIVQIRFNSVPIYSKFAFHPIILLIVILAFDVCGVANGQRNPGE